MSEENDKPRRLDVDWVKVVAGALAAVSSAVLLSTLGAAGTLIGAALGSVIVSITTSFYGQTLARGTEKVAEAQTVALRKMTSATQEIRQLREESPAADGDAGGATASSSAAEPTPEDADAALEHATEQLEEATEELERASEETEAIGAGAGRASLRERLGALPWKRTGIVALATFAVAMVIVTAFEVIGGQSLSSYTDPRESGTGTSIGGLLGGGTSSDDGGETPVEDPTDDTTPRPGSPATERPTDPSTTGDVDPGEGTTTPPRDDDTTTDEPTDEPDEDDEPTTPTPTPTPTAPAPSPTR